MHIEKVMTGKKRYLELLLLGDEQEFMIDRYLEKGDLYALFDGDLKSVCVITRENEKQVEIKNIATWPKAQRKGYGKALLSCLFEKYAPLAEWITSRASNQPKYWVFIATPTLFGFIPSQNTIAPIFSILIHK